MPISFKLGLGSVRASSFSTAASGISWASSSFHVLGLTSHGHSALLQWISFEHLLPVSLGLPRHTFGDLLSPVLERMTADSPVLHTQTADHGKLDEPLLNHSPCHRKGNSCDLLSSGDGSVDLQGRPVVRSKTGRWKACYYLFCMEVAERIAYYAVASNLVLYLAKVLQEGLEDAVTHVNYWAGAVFLTPLLGGFIADTFLGRYWTALGGSAIHLLGGILLTMSVSLPGLKPPRCGELSSPCPKASAGQIALFYISLFLLSLGSGGIKPCVSSLGADQFDAHDETEKALKHSFFHLWFCGIGAGILFSVTVLVYVEDNVDWGWSFALVTTLMALAIAAFVSGTPLYRHKPPQGSPLTQFAQVFTAAISKWRLPLPSSSDLLYEEPDKAFATSGRRKMAHTNSLSLLDKAAIQPELNSGTFPSNSPWRLCGVTQVEELKLFMRILPIWVTNLMFQTAYAQTLTFFTKQASTLDGRLGSIFTIPPASFTVFSALALMTTTFAFATYLMPLLRKVTKHPQGLSLLQRMGAGMFLTIVSMVTAALTEQRRLRVASDSGLTDQGADPLPMSIFCLLPQYVIGGVADSLIIVANVEFFYSEAPDHMRSMATALGFSMSGIGTVLSSGILALSNAISRAGGGEPWIVDNLNRSHLDKFYWLLAFLSSLSLVAFMLVSSRYQYKDTFRSVPEMAAEAEVITPVIHSPQSSVSEK